MQLATGALPVRVVVIEDTQSDVFFLDLALKEQDLQIELIHLKNGDEALAFIHWQDSRAGAVIPDLILLDLNLRKYHGEEILTEIRAARHLAGVPVCIWSTSQYPEDRALLLRQAGGRFISKPVGLDEFMKIGKIIADLLPKPGSP